MPTTLAIDEIRTILRRREQHGELENAGVIVLDGHFDLGNGWHSDVYFKADQVLEDTELLLCLMQNLIEAINPTVLREVDFVGGPPTGGLIISPLLSILIGSKRPPGSVPVKQLIFRKNKCGEPVLSRRSRISVRGKSALLADDVENTGFTLGTCMAQVENCGGKVVGTAVIYDRVSREGRFSRQCPHFPLAAPAPSDRPQNFRPGEGCPLCVLGIPITKFG